MDSKKMLSFMVFPELVAEALRLPEKHKIVGCVWDFDHQSIRLYVEGEDLPEIEQGNMVPQVTPTISVSVEPDGSRKYQWNWNL